MLDTLAKIQNVLDDFTAKVPSVGPLAPLGPWRLAEDKAVSFPGANRPGVYFFLGSNGELVYVGKASYCLGRRLGSGYFDRAGNVTEAKLAGASVLYTVALPTDLFFLAPALEELLIHSFNWQVNRVGRRGVL